VESTEDLHPLSSHDVSLLHGELLLLEQAECLLDTEDRREEAGLLHLASGGL